MSEQTGFLLKEGFPEDGIARPPVEYPGFDLERQKSLIEQNLNAIGEKVPEGANYDNIFAKALNVLKEEYQPSKMYLAEDQSLALENIDYHLKKAMVNHLMGETDAQLKGEDKDTGILGEVSTLYDRNVDEAYKLAFVIKPRIELIYDLMRYVNKIKRIMGDPAKGIPPDPDYQRCIFRLNNTLEYLKQDVAPQVQQFLELTQGMAPGMGMGLGPGMMAPGMGMGLGTELTPGMPGPHREKGVTMFPVGGAGKGKRKKRSTKRKKKRSPRRRKSRREATVIAF